MTQIILASNSPRRKELLTLLGLSFTTQVSEIDERALEQKLVSFLPQERAAKMAEAKGRAVFVQAPKDSIVIAADTIVVYENEILHKPVDDADAVAILTRLSGHTHMVYTGMSVLYKKADGTEMIHTGYTGTAVTFRTLTQSEIAAYVATGEPSDKAGAYGIQGKGCFLVEKIEGDYQNVVGLSLKALYTELKDNGFDVTTLW